MKSVTQTVVLIAVLFVLVGGITFVYQWLPSVKPPAEGVNSGALVFPVTVGSPSEYELQQPGTCDFPFQNPTRKPVQLIGKHLSCVCSDAAAGTLAAGDWDEAVRWAAGFELPQALAAPGGSLGLVATSAVVTRKMRWQPVEKDQAMTIPAAESPDRPTLGVVRLHWKGKKLGPQRLAVEMEEGGGTPYRLEAPVNFVTSLLVYPTRLELPQSLEAGGLEQQTVQLVCWSSTRSGFGLEAREASGDPCFACTCARLEGDELYQAVAEANGPRPLWGYRVAVTVSEQHGGRHLDLGPLHRRLVLKPTDPDIVPLIVDVGGLVRGDVWVTAGEEKDRVPLGNFLAIQGQTRDVLVESNQAGLDLEVAAKSPDYLNVKLSAPRQTDYGLKQWHLTVAVPPNRASGPFTSDSAVTLRTKGEHPRGIRIPVTGNATVR